MKPSEYINTFLESHTIGLDFSQLRAGYQNEIRAEMGFPEWDVLEKMFADKEYIILHEYQIKDSKFKNKEYDFIIGYHGYPTLYIFKNK
jgi:protoheme ferro-lyase